MYCRKCGAEISDDSKFCTKCGTKVITIEAAKSTESNKAPNAADDVKAAGTTTAIETAETTDAATPAAAQPRSAAGLTQAVASTKSRSRRRVPLIVLVALGIALAAGTAYAAYYVYTEVIAPMAQTEQPDASVEEDQPEASEEEAIPEAAPSAGNIFQVANLIAMGQSDANAYAEESGCVAETLGPNDTASTLSYIQRYSLDGQGAEYLSETSAPSCITGLYSLDLSEGQIFNMHNLYYADEEYTPSGSMDSALVTFNLAGTPTDDELTELLEYCNLDDPAAQYSYTDTPYTINGYTSRSMGNTECYAGWTSINGQQMLWYLFIWASSDSEARAYLGCCPMELALELVEENNLFTKEQWDAASDDEKADMLVKSMTQEAFSGQNSFCRNVLTGQWRATLDRYEDFDSYEEADAAYRAYSGF